jgi:hypothetical protein
VAEIPLDLLRVELRFECLEVRESAVAPPGDGVGAFVENRFLVALEVAQPNDRPIFPPRVVRDG